MLAEGPIKAVNETIEWHDVRKDVITFGIEIGLIPVKTKPESAHLSFPSDFDFEKLYSQLPPEIHDNFQKVFVRFLKNEISIKWGEEIYFRKYAESLNCSSLGRWPQELVDVVLLCDFKTKSWLPVKDLMLRAKCEKYFHESSVELKNSYLNDVKDYIVNEGYGKSDKLPEYLPYSNIDRNLLKNVYLSNDASLIGVFSKYLPIPRETFFYDGVIPDCIAKREKIINENIRGFIEKNKEIGFEKAEKYVTYLQRLYRKKKRQQSESKRIPQRNFLEFEKINPLEYEKHIKKGQGIYVPQRCDRELSQKIVNFSFKVKFFNYIKHETKLKALKNIFTDGLYGRSTLEAMLQVFSPAALCENDVANGDGNAICFGADYSLIDPKASGEVEFILDFNKINFGENKSESCAFFKQKDFGFGGKFGQDILLGNKSIRIGYTKKPFKNGCETMLLVFNDEAYFSIISNFKLISYDLENIEQILILNFFKFLDNLIVESGEDASVVISEIYKEIKGLNDEELMSFLEMIGRALSGSMEFNFFGAHKIDFNTFVSIKTLRSPSLEPDENGCLRFISADNFELKMSELLEQLTVGELEILNVAKKEFAGLFESYRFLDYLMSKTAHPIALDELARLYTICKTPAWYPKKEMLSFNQNCEKECPDSDEFKRRCKF